MQVQGLWQRRIVEDRADTRLELAAKHLSASDERLRDVFGVSRRSVDDLALRPERRNSLVVGEPVTLTTGGGDLRRVWPLRGPSGDIEQVLLVSPAELQDELPSTTPAIYLLTILPLSIGLLVILRETVRLRQLLGRSRDRLLRLAEPDLEPLLAENKEDDDREWFGSNVPPGTDEGLHKAIDRIASRTLEQEVADRARLGSLATQSDYLTTILNTLHDGVLSVDAEQRVRFANPAAIESLEPSTVRPETRPLYDVLRNPRVHRLAEEAERQQQTLAEEVKIGPDQKIVAVRAVPIPASSAADAETRGPEERSGIVLVLRDMTELRQLEGMRRTFVSNVSHELKTPLTSIMAMTELLQDGALDDRPAAERFVATIATESERLHRLVMDLLELSRIDGRPVAEGDQLPGLTDDISALLEETAEARRANAEARRLALRIELPTADEVAHHAAVAADADELRLVAGNLLDNAIRYTSEGDAITLRAWFADEAEVVVEVEDTGIGIPAKHHERIFERFYRVDKARSRTVGGTGLGLAIVKNTVIRLGGEIGVESEVNVGSRFTVRLPLVGSPNDAGSGADSMGGAAGE